MPKTLFEKIWGNHWVAEEPDSPAVLYIDLHLVPPKGIARAATRPYCSDHGPFHPDCKSLAAVGG